MSFVESYIQQSCVRWFRLQYSNISMLLFATPNSAARSKKNASRMKAEGMVAGVADLILLLPRKGYGALCIEMKTDTGKQSQSQKQWQEVVEKHGNKYVVCRNFEEFEAQINDYLR